MNTAFSDNPAAGCAVGVDGSVLLRISAAFSEDRPERTIMSVRVAPERVESVCPV